MTGIKHATLSVKPNNAEKEVSADVWNEEHSAGAAADVLSDFMLAGIDGRLASLSVDNSGIHVLDTNASHDLILAVGSDLTADKTLTLTTGDADRTITLNGNPTLGDWFDQSVKQAASPTLAGLTLTSFSGFVKATAGILSAAALSDNDIPDTITLTNITQITNRSHTSLSDIGTLTHATIDNYLDQAVKTTSDPTFSKLKLTDQNDSTFELVYSGYNSVFLRNYQGYFIIYHGTPSIEPSTTWTPTGDLFLSGQLILNIQGSAGGLLIGGDANIFRGAANILQTDDDFEFTTSAQSIIVKDTVTDTRYRIKVVSGVVTAVAV